MSMDSLNPTTDFPPKSSLWPGSLLATLAHAVSNARSPLFSYEQSWKGRFYNLQDTMGARGCVAFGKDTNCFVAVFSLLSSQRYSHREKEPLSGLPEQLKDLSKEALQYMLEEVHGAAAPVLTSAFWSDPNSDRIAANEPWSDVLKHGACLISRQLLPAETALEQWAIECGFTAKQRSLAESIFKRRMAEPAGSMELSPSEIHKARNVALTEEGLQACRETLAEIAIILP